MLRIASCLPLVAASLVLAACSRQDQPARHAGEAAQAAPAAQAPQDQVRAPAAGEDRAPAWGPAPEITRHAWHELARNDDKGEWFNPAPGLAVAFPLPAIGDGIAEDRSAPPRPEFEIYPNHRASADGKPLTESAVMNIDAIDKQGNTTVLRLLESYRIVAKPADELGVMKLKVEISPVAGSEGVYRWHFSYDSPDPCLRHDPCKLYRPLWAGRLGTRYFERAQPDDAPPLDQTAPADAPIGGGKQ